MESLANGFLAFLTSLTASYALVVFAAFIGLYRLRRKGPSPSAAGPRPFITVIVAARNESENVDACLGSLLAQDYPTDRYEVIFVDDHSMDDTRARAEAYLSRATNLRVLSLADFGDESFTGKQQALDVGIRQSHGELIASTDADCVVPTTWLSAIAEAFEPDTGVVVGFSMMDGPHDGERLFIKVQSLELLGLFAGFAGALGWNVATACTGNNLAYRRAAYEELGGFTKMGFTVAEDNMFLQWVNRHTTWQIRVLFDPRATVRTEPMRTFRSFLRQRLRWASNSLENRFAAVWFGVVAYGVNWLVPTALLLGAFGWVSFRWAGALLGLKLLPETLLVWRGLGLFRRRDLMKYVPLAAAFQTFYVLIVGIAGLSGRVVWKNRPHRTQRKGPPRPSEGKNAKDVA